MNDIVYVGKHVLTVSIARHTHPTWELVYCMTGNGSFQFENRVIQYAQGEMVVIPPMLPHSNASEDGFTNIYININNAGFSFSTPIVIQDDSMQTLLSALNSAYYHFNNSEHGHTRQMMAAYGDLICSYVSTYNKTEPLSRIVEQIQSSIIDNYPDCNYHLDAFLKRLPFSDNYIRKLFKKELGVTPHNYLMDKRLSAAAAMLSYDFGGGNNITEIASMCGFNDSLYFSRMFKKKYHIAPSYYAAKVRRSSASAVTEDQPDR